MRFQSHRPSSGDQSCPRRCPAGTSEPWTVNLVDPGRTGDLVARRDGRCSRSRPGFISGVEPRRGPGGDPARRRLSGYRWCIRTERQRRRSSSGPAAGRPPLMKHGLGPMPSGQVACCRSKSMVNASRAYDLLVRRYSQQDAKSVLWPFDLTQHKGACLRAALAVIGRRDPTDVRQAVRRRLDHYASRLVSLKLMSTTEVEKLTGWMRELVEAVVPAAHLSLTHHDLHLPNVLVRPVVEIWLIDLDFARPGDPVDDFVKLDWWVFDGGPLQHAFRMAYDAHRDPAADRDVVRQLLRPPPAGGGTRAA
jgi:hypothetical protein